VPRALATVSTSRLAAVVGIAVWLTLTAPQPVAAFEPGPTKQTSADLARPATAGVPLGEPASVADVGDDRASPGDAERGPWWTWHPPRHLDELPASRSGHGGQVRYTLPVHGAVLRAFEAPTHTFGSGHRGVDLDARPGDAVRAAGTGRVTFAGAVGGVRWVSIAHADGVLTSYGPVGSAQVTPGDVVARGQLIARLAGGGHGDGASDRGLHWGARRGGRYIDPLSLLSSVRPSLTEPGGWAGIDLAVAPYDPWQGGRFGGLAVAGSPVAARPGYAVPPGPNRLVQISGLGSTAASRPLDSEHLGYRPGDADHVSYAGVGPEGTPRPHGPEDTWAGVDAAALALRDQLRRQAAAEPGRAVDLVGHSMGGVVVLRYLTRYHDPYDRTLPPIGAVVTVAAPLRGSDVASLGTALRDHSLAGPIVTGVREVLVRTGLPGGQLPLHHRALDDLAVGSELLDELAREWDAALAASGSGPLAMGTRVLTIGGRGDLVVPIMRSGQPTARLGPVNVALHLTHDEPAVTHRVLPGGHSAVLSTEAVREVVWRFLADQDVVESPGHLATWASAAHAGGLQLVSGSLRLHELIESVRRPLQRTRTPPTAPLTR
jgi:murein DD-endopeptidase MepM/ murein hydrolase activator NlpD